MIDSLGIIFYVNNFIKKGKRMDNITQREEKVKLAIEIAIKLSLLSIVISLSPVINSLEKRFGNRKRVIIGFTVTIIAALLIPTYMLSGSMIESSTTLVHAMKDGNVTIPPPTEKVKEWPLIGEKAYAFWDSASHNLKETLEPFNDNIKKNGRINIFSIRKWVGHHLYVCWFFYHCCGIAHR